MIYHISFFNFTLDEAFGPSAMSPKLAWCGESIQEDYEVLKSLGSGKFAEVYEVKSKSSKSLA